jgi:hypothetical protein
MGKWVVMPRVGGQKYHGHRGRYIMVSGVKIPWEREIKIPWVSGSIYHGQGGQNTMGRGSKYHG